MSIIRIKLTLGMGYLEDAAEEIGEQPWANASYYARQELGWAVEHAKCALEHLGLAEGGGDEPETLEEKCDRMFTQMGLVKRRDKR